MIDQESFLLLNDEALKEMISAVGPRIKLQKKLRELQVSFLTKYGPSCVNYVSLLIFNLKYTFPKRTEVLG